MMAQREINKLDFEELVNEAAVRDARIMLYRVPSDNDEEAQKGLIWRCCLAAYVIDGDDEYSPDYDTEQQAVSVLDALSQMAVEILPKCS